MKPIQTILHPTDFSENSEYALALAASLARDQGARLVLLHVVPSAEAVTGAGDAKALDRAEKAMRGLKVYREEMAAKLQELRHPYPKIRVERLLREGGVATGIVRAAAETASDLIVMGTHGHTGEAKWLMGSVAEAVTRKAPCAVLTVRVPRAPGSLSCEPAAELAGRST